MSISNINSINFVQLVSPTTSSYRMKRIVKDSHDMIYYISMLSTTGGRLKVSPKEILENYNKIKKINKSKNLVIGFGITIIPCETLIFFDTYSAMESAALPYATTKIFP